MGVENCPAPRAERHARRACSSCDCSSSCQPAPFLRKWFTTGAPYLPRHGVSFVCHPPDTSCSSATDPCPATDASVCSERSLRLEPACSQLSTEAWNAPRLHCRAGLTLSHAAHRVTVSSACGGPSSPASAFAALLYARGPLTSEVYRRAARRPSRSKTFSGRWRFGVVTFEGLKQFYRAELDDRSLSRSVHRA